MITYNEAELRDKIHACWVGKNIGGTMGTPYEGKREMNDISGFVTDKGVILPNDDLDLQLIWLVAMEEYGPYQMNANVLGEYWFKYIPPEWNEYGVGKSNLRAGLLPPLSGEIHNSKWKTSNGAWIRSEVWACMAPGFPEIAVKYAQMDASVDHGMSEGTYAEWFTAALDSLAFRGGEIRELIEQALFFIPADSRVARSVRLVLTSFDKGVDYRKTRELLVKDSEDLGWFQAPANIGFTVLGLIYGEGDFKKSMIYAINCGDDTDCTGATVGAFLGILYGSEGVPADWSEYIGDDIVTKAIDASCEKAPATCSELTERVMKMIPAVMKAHWIDAAISNGATDLSDEEDNKKAKHAMKELEFYKPYSYFGADVVYAQMYVSFAAEPQIKEGESLTAYITIKNRFPDPRNFYFKPILPEGFTASAYERCIHVANGDVTGFTDTSSAVWSVTITAGERLEPVNKVIVEITSPGKAMAAYVPIVFLG